MNQTLNKKEMANNNSQDKFHILIVDDEALVIKALTRSLKNKNLIIHSAENILDAISIFNSYDISVVISDFEMPGGTGSDLFSRINAKSHDCLRIMLTGADRAETVPKNLVRECLGCDKFIIKPWNDDYLIGVINEYLYPDTNK